ncbi:hypothetical protein FQA39_LY11112 [Lamprigera yunnana]|nr:hypothetical protein FQA39_LY11112 [Lamprigera yunnana]
MVRTLFSELIVKTIEKRLGYTANFEHRKSLRLEHQDMRPRRANVGAVGKITSTTGRKTTESNCTNTTYMYTHLHIHATGGNRKHQHCTGNWSSLLAVKLTTYWKKLDVPYIKPWPIVGNMLSLVMKTKSISEFIQDVYNVFPNERLVGMFSFLNHQLLVRDLDLIKQMTIKDFDHFMDRTLNVNKDVEPLFARNLMSLTGQKWKDMRATLSPTFTSSKMKFMFNVVSECALQFTKHFKEQDFDILEVDTKEVATRFTNDAIATAAFGISLNSLKERNNKFYMIGKDLTNFTGLRGLKFLGYSLFPSLMKFLKIPLFSGSHNDFFRNIIKNNIRDREENGIVRPDMVQILWQARKDKAIEDEKEEHEAGFAVAHDTFSNQPNEKHTVMLTDDDITAQAFLFFFGGFETTSTLICFMSHELATNPDVQTKLQKEIDEATEKCGGKINYETLLEMKYLDMVISESLRKWPPGFSLDRKCVKDYVINREKEGKPPLTIVKGLSILIPVLAIHHNPIYFPNPDKFDPERFSDENKHTIVPLSYMPFGSGPRNCIASRFALMETKILFFYLLSVFDLVPTKKTVVPLVLSKKIFALAPDNGFWIGFKPRKLTC